MIDAAKGAAHTAAQDCEHRSGVALSARAAQPLQSRQHERCIVLWVVAALTPARAAFRGGIQLAGSRVELSPRAGRLQLGEEARCLEPRPKPLHGGIPEAQSRQEDSHRRELHRDVRHGNEQQWPSEDAVRTQADAEEQQEHGG